VLGGAFEGKGVIIALYDRKRPTTGYHFAIQRRWGGFDVYCMLGQKCVFYGNEKPPERPPPILLDVVSTAPRPDWPVESRAVSAYDMRYIPYGDFYPDGTLDVVVRVNGEVVGSYTLAQGLGALPPMELPLPAISEKALQ
jgi:hypothetical protein